MAKILKLNQVNLFQKVLYSLFFFHELKTIIKKKRTQSKSTSLPLHFLVTIRLSIRSVPDSLPKKKIQKKKEKERTMW